MGATEFFQGVGHSLGYPLEYSLCMVADLKQVRQPGQSEDPGPFANSFFPALGIAWLKCGMDHIRNAQLPGGWKTQLPTGKKQLPTVKSALKSP